MDPQLRLQQLTRLADILWYERRLMEYLLFKLVTANLMLNADDQRFIAPAIGEVDRIIAEIRKTEADRAGIVAGLAAEWGVPAGSVTLAYLAVNAPEELREVFEDHRNRFLALTGEIESVTKENRRLATLGLSGISGSFGILADGDADPGLYDASGRHRSERQANPARIDEVL